MEVETEEQKEGDHTSEVEEDQKKDDQTSQAEEEQNQEEHASQEEEEEKRSNHTSQSEEQEQADHTSPEEEEQKQGDHKNEAKEEQNQDDHTSQEEGEEKKGDHTSQPQERNPLDRADGQNDHFERGQNFLDFENILLDVRLRKAILYLFKFKHPTKIQKAAIPHILQGKDVIISSKTGSGKTMAYLIPLVQNIVKSNLNEKESLKFFYKGIILAPTEELCLQIYEVAQTLCSYLKNILSFNHNINKTFYDHPTVLVTTPKHLYNHTVECKRKYNLDILSNLRILVVDEADILHSREFQKWMNLLASYHFPKNYSQKYQIVMASATLKESLVEKTKLFLHKPVFLSEELEKNASPTSRTTFLSVDHPEGLHKRGAASNRDSSSVPVRSNKMSDASGTPKVREPVMHQQFRGKSFCYLYPDETTKYIYLYDLINEKVILHKSIIFTSTIHDAYKIKIFLTYFDIASSILNPNHPILVRQNIIFAFNNYKIFFLICPQYEKNAAARGGRKGDMGDMGNMSDMGDIDNMDSIGTVRSGGDTDDTGDATNHDDSGFDGDTNDADANDTDRGEDLRSNLDDGSEEEKDFLYNRGLDFQGVHCVVNFDMPLDTKTFVHRVGRTCRLDNKGISISFVNENKPAEKKLLQKIGAKNICTINHKAVAQNKVEMYRYRVESILIKCTNKKVKHFIQKEILYQSLKSKELKEFFNSNEDEKRTINKIVKHFNTHVVPQKLIKDRLKNLFLKKPKRKGISKNGMRRKGKESGDMSRDKRNQKHNGMTNGREDEKRAAQQHYVKSKSNGFVLTEQAYQDQLRKEPETEVADPTKLPPIYGKRLRSYVYNKYVMGKRRRGSSALGGRANSGKANNGRANSGKANSGKANSGKANSGKVNSGRANSGKANSVRANNGRANGGRANSGRSNVSG
ncbi:adenosinetriphosphatase [Plasmodium inui San Antonio 1]|uniref:Adenosinetriphosphatase n=1 Tax=Plasmodium inui San Antonio 1 TaxID=1237626 RepID=W7AAM1_9APIC|nr:adenosinetriphosphatase [Plasmodium inui San Antonio 1]EUD66119.1 adenosinetriphosphatase [Plasmodium inui San Antonio 1]